MKNIILVAAVSMLVTACAQTPSQPTLQSALQPSTQARAVPEITGPNWSSRTVLYQCQGGTQLQVAYLGMKSGESFAALHFNGNTSLLQARQLTAGLRYIALDEQNSLRWAPQSGMGTLSFMAADHTVKEQVLLSGCKALP